MQYLINTNHAFNGAQVPAPIEQEGFWELDVDSKLWADVYLDDAFEGLDAPMWLCDQPTKQGIRAMLGLRRCKEEIE
jgi:hypothetical protein